MRSDELLQAVIPTIYRAVPEGARLVGREVGKGIVMTDASAPGALALRAAQGQHRGIADVILNVLGYREANTGDFAALKAGVEAYFAEQIDQVPTPAVQRIIEEDQHLILRTMARALGMSE